jgi:hypothetical protein
VRLSTRKQNMGEVQILTALYTMSHYEITSTGKKTPTELQYTQGHIVIDVRHVRFNMSDKRSDGDRCNKKGHKTRELSQQV